MNIYSTDENNEEVLLSSDGKQVMMEWERPYMEKSIDVLNPTGDVLEIGWGCGYSASQIMKYNPSSYTVIECDPTVIKRALKWKEQYDIPITIIEGTWQTKLSTLGKFDSIYFDDFPLHRDSTNIMEEHRLLIFLTKCLQNHSKIGTRISFYVNDDTFGSKKYNFSSDIEPFITLQTTRVNVPVSKLCKYRNIKENHECIIPLITVDKSFSYQEIQKFVDMQIKIATETPKHNSV